KTDHYESIHRMCAKDGSYREILDRGKVVSRDADGTPLRVIGTHQDITDQRSAEAAARELQRQMTALLRFSPTLVTVIDREGRYLQASAAVATTIGRPVGEIVGRLLEDVLPQEIATQFRSRLTQLLRSGRHLDVEDSVGPAGAERRFRTV